MNHKTCFNGLLVLLMQFFLVQNVFAVTYPIQVNPSFSINAANQFDLRQTETVGALQSRLKTLLQHSEIFPTGFYVQAGTTLQLDVSSLGGTHSAYGKVIITDRYAGGSTGAYTQTVTLANGTNNINVTASGNVFISYSASVPDANRQLRFTFNSGYTLMPLFIKNQTTTAEWLDMLQNYASTSDVMFIFKRGVMVLDRAEVETYKNNDFNRIITALDDITDVEVAGAGIIATTNQNDKNRDFGNLLYITSNNGSRVSTTNPHAANPGLVRVPVDWIATTNHIFGGGAWGISHEIGHHQQQNAWDWGVNTEVQVNIHTMMARKLLYPSETGIDTSGSWRAAAFYLVKDNATKDYDNASIDLKAKIPLFWQLQLSFGNNDFYKQFYRYVRENSVNAGTADSEKLNFMKTANAIFGKNLCDYFIQWGLNPTTSQQSTLNAMGLPLPNISPLTYAEDNLLENFTLLKDTIVYEGQPVNYKVVALAINGVKKIEFYDGGTKIGASTEFPFQFTFTPTFGTHTITAKLIDGLDNTILTTNAVNITVNRAQIISPNNGAYYKVNQNIPISVETATIPANNLLKVEYYDNDSKIGETTTTPTQFVLTNANRGIHKLMVKAYYQNGDISQSADVYANVGGLFPDADSYVRDGSSAKNNYGKDAGLVVKEDVSSYKRYTYLKFNLSDIQQTPFTKATLKLSIDGIKTSVANKTDWELYFVSSDTWLEDEINFNNRPLESILLASQRSVASGAVEWDITNQLNTELSGDKYISLMLKSTVLGANYDVTFGAKENQNVNIRPVLQLYNADEYVTQTTIVSPQQMDYFNVNASVPIKVNTPIYQGNALQKIEFFLDGSKIGESSSTPYQLSTASLLRGRYEISAKAYYQDGTISDAQKITILVGLLYADADTYVHDATTAKSSNFGLEEKLVVKRDGSGYNRQSYLRFDLSSIGEQNFGKVSLRLNEIRTNTGVGNPNTWQLYFIADDTWAETTMNYNNRPTVLGDKMAELTQVKLNGNTSIPLEWDITNYVNTELLGDKKISMVLLGSAINQKGDADFASREHSDETLRPTLNFYTSTQVLPVNLINFNLQATPIGVQLSWQVATETNHKQYIISRSLNGKDFSRIGTTSSHSYLDNITHPGTYYYTLSQEDNDGKITALATRTINFNISEQNVLVYPNPTNGAVIVNLFEKNYQSYSLLDMQGKMIKSGKIMIPSVQMELDLKNLVSGSYLLVLKKNNGSSTVRIIRL